MFVKPRGPAAGTGQVYLCTGGALALSFRTSLFRGIFHRCLAPWPRVPSKLIPARGWDCSGCSPRPGWLDSRNIHGNAEISPTSHWSWSTCSEAEHPLLWGELCCIQTAHGNWEQLQRVGRGEPQTKPENPAWREKKAKPAKLKGRVR